MYDDKAKVAVTRCSNTVFSRCVEIKFEFGLMRLFMSEIGSNETKW